MADFAFLHQKVVGGDQDKGVLLEDIRFNVTQTKDGDPIAEAEIVGTAKTVLKDNYDSTGGRTDLPEELPVKARIKFIQAKDKPADNQISFQILNRLFDIQPPLVDSEEVWERFTKDGENSVYDTLVGKYAYFQTKLAPGKLGEKASDFFFNIADVGKRDEALMGSVKDKMKAAFAKKKAVPVASTFNPED